MSETLTFYPCPRCGQNMAVREVTLPPSTTTGLTQTMRTATCRYCEPVTPAPRREDAAGARLAQIAARLNAATPGPWYVAMHGSDGLKRDVFQREPEKRWDHPLTTYLSSANAEFIANAPEDIKYLLAALSTAERDVKRWRFVRERLMVWTEKYMSGDSAPTLAGRIGCTRLPADTPIATNPDEIDRAIDHALARVPSGGET